MRKRAAWWAIHLSSSSSFLRRQQQKQPGEGKRSRRERHYEIKNEKPAIETNQGRKERKRDCTSEKTINRRQHSSLVHAVLCTKDNTLHSLRHFFLPFFLSCRRLQHEMIRKRISLSLPLHSCHSVCLFRSSSYLSYTKKRNTTCVEAWAQIHARILIDGLEIARL